MTSRTTPVGILVLALAGIFVMGCNAQTSAVFEALLDPGRALESSSEADAVADDGWWAHPDDGYQMTLPSGWFGVGLDGAETSQMVSAVATTHPALAGRLETVLGDTGSVVSAIAADPSAGEMSPILVVIRQPDEGRRRYELKQHVKKQISQVPGLAASPIVQGAGLPRVRNGWRFDYSIMDADLGPLRVRSYLVPFGDDAYLVNFVASEAVVDDADSVFDAIAQSLRFGV
jgi:hypothetical protein